MGIKYLNKFLMDNCSIRSIRRMYFRELEGKTITVDISIYMYHFLGDGMLMENMYLLLSILKYYCVTPIFIFDGKPPPEKWELIKQRNSERRQAKHKYYELIESGLTVSPEELETLRKKMVKLTQEDITQTKELIDAFGFTYINAPNEADHLCVSFVRTGIAYACLSDDCDMFLLNCPRVIRCLSLMKRSAMIYHTDNILRELDIGHGDFLKIMVLTGTDFNTQQKRSLKVCLDLYKQFKIDNVPLIDDFNEWMCVKKHVQNKEQFESLCDMFNMDTIITEYYSIMNDYTNQDMKRNDINKIKQLMIPYNFIFV